MDAIQKYVRIYGIDEGCEDSFLSYFKDCIDKTIEMKDYPRENEKIFIHIGKPLESIFNANKLKLATGVTFLKKAFGLTDKSDFEEEIKKELSELRTYPKVSDYNFYVTLIFQKKIEIDDDDILDNDFYWLNQEKSEEFEKEIKFIISKCFDILITHFAYLSDIQFFENLVLNNQTYYSAPGKMENGIVKLKTTAKASVIVTNPLEYTMVSNLIDRVSEKGFNDYGWLANVAHFRLASILEEDPWKQYYFLFSSFESLIEVFVKNTYSEMEDRFFIKINDETTIDQSNIPFQISKNIEDFNLKERFGILAFELFPDDIKNDYKVFLELKKIRDDMSHGRPVDNNVIPLSNLISLLDKYLNKLIEKELNK